MLITLAQMEVSHDLGRNKDKVIDTLEATQPGEHVIFPEGMLTGYFPEEAEYLSLLRPDSVKNAVQEIRKLVQARQCIGYVGLARYVLPDEKRNSVGIFTPDGHVQYYDKIGISYADSTHFTPGDQQPPCSIDGTMVGLRICRELMDPWRWQGLRTGGARIAVHANNAIYPHDRVWEHLIVARAVENQMYVASSNNASSPSELGSYLVSPAGEILLSIDPQAEERATTEIDPKNLSSPYAA